MTSLHCRISQGAVDLVCYVKFSAVSVHSCIRCLLLFQTLQSLCTFRYCKQIKVILSAVSLLKKHCKK